MARTSVGMNAFPIIWRGVLVIAAAVVLTACLDSRPIYPAAGMSPGQSKALEYTSGKVPVPYVVIEFGDQGDALDPAQKELARREIHNKRKPLLVVFVHGWHSDATSPQEDPHYRFNEFLDNLASSPTVVNHGFQVIGAYIGWHGNAATNKLFYLYDYPFSFWSRYEVGRQLGAGVDCRAAISDLVEEARSKGRENSRTFLIGHSFGALVLQQAVAQSVNEATRQGIALAPADLTIFLNPASDSEVTRQMIERMQSNISVVNDTTAGDHPVFVTLSSETDVDTGLLFPLGKSLASSGKRFDHLQESAGTGRPGETEDVSGRYFFTHTPGNNEYLISHTTTDWIKSSGTEKDAFEANLNTRPDPHNPQFKTSKAAGEDGATGQEWRLWRLERVGARQRTPYWIIRVDKYIMDGHNDIMNPRARALMAMLYRLSDDFINRTHSETRLQRVAPKPPVPLQSKEETEAHITEAKSMSPLVRHDLVAPSTPAPTPAADRSEPHTRER